MARRRLAPMALPVPEGPAPDGRPDVPRAEHLAPIARVAAEAAGTAALQELSETLARARETGRMVLDLALDAIAPDHLARDRIPAEDAEMATLRESIRAHGQRTPIEVTPLAVSSTGDALPYGLISGWRRLAALKALHAETGEARFATVQALVRRPETAADAYVTMVEENEIRLGLSQYERARVAALATERGVFASEKAALLALFATASRPKRSRIRAFLEIYHALDGTLRFPAALPERLGLALVERLRAGRRPAHRRGPRHRRAGDRRGRAGAPRPPGAATAVGRDAGVGRPRAPPDRPRRDAGQPPQRPPPDPDPDRHRPRARRPRRGGDRGGDRRRTGAGFRSGITAGIPESYLPIPYRSRSRRFGKPQIVPRAEQFADSRPGLPPHGKLMLNVLGSVAEFERAVMLEKATGRDRQGQG